MSLDIKDHRRHLKAVDDKLEAEEAAKPKVLLEQRKVADETGDPRLDKLMRIVAANIEEADKHMTQAALVSVESLDEKQVALMKREYAFTKGLIQAYQEVLKIPAQIIVEERGNPTL